MKKNTLFVDLMQSAWAVYRITTQSSVYILGMHRHNDRRTVVVKGELGSDKESIVVRDTDPRIGSQSLWDVPFADWVGESLEIGTMTTSTIRMVAKVTDARTINSVTGAGLMVRSSGDGIAVGAAGQLAPSASNVRTEPQPVRPPYPENYVRYAEDAAGLLRAILRKDQLQSDLDDEPLLRARLGVALTDCALQLESLSRRFEQ